MSELLSKLGIDWRLFIAQIINFLVLFFVLKKFLYKPAVAMLERRRETIEKSLEDAKKMEESVARMSAENEKRLQEVKKESARILEAAAVRAEKMHDEKIGLTRKDVEKIIEQGKAQMAEERAEVLRSVRGEAATLIADALAAVLKDIPHEKINKALIDESLKKIS